MKGVLKSWAIPKGPSTDPSVKRLAMMVEDHPFDYRDFEGIIPKGNYGAGSVIVWDYGTYEPLQVAKNKADAERILLKELEQGSLKFRLYGQKLKGEFALVKLKGKEDNAWLMIKHRDSYASEKDITEKDRSVISGKKIEKIATAPHHVYGKKGLQPAEPKVKNSASKTQQKNAPLKKKLESGTLKNDSKGKPDFRGATKSAMPKNVSPMLATLVDHAMDEPGWRYEIKWDGYRALAYCNGKEVGIFSRNNKSFDEKFYPIHRALIELNLKAVLDGEIAVLNPSGLTNFNALQNWRSEADGELAYYVFDLLWLNGYNLMTMPLYRRRELMQSIFSATGVIRQSSRFEASAKDFLAAAKKLGLEGIIAKKDDSTYQPGQRSRDWLKIKIQNRHEVVIGGFTRNQDSPKEFSSLLVGVYNNGILEYTGKIGTGFNQKQQKEMMARFRTLYTNKVPFDTIPDVNKPSRFRPDPPHATAQWLKPELVCEVSYTEITGDGLMRHPSFEGMREDKKAKEVIKEKKAKVEQVMGRENVERKSKKSAMKSTKDETAILDPVEKTDRKSLLNPSEETQVKTINKKELKFSNLSKIYWPKEKYTKRDMLNYYYQVAPYILPYLVDRPQSLNRYPNGIGGKSFYQKDVTGKAPSWVKTFPYTTGEGEHKNFLVVEDEASLLWMANLGAIEMNPWSSSIKKPDNPDWSIVDIDPSDKNNFDQVVSVAQKTKEILDEMKITAYCKTSGATGMHIYIPLGAKYEYTQSQLLARIIATAVHKALPDLTSIERLTGKRRGKIYMDFLQNRPQATLAAPYCVRPKPGATVSMPLEWDEVEKGLRPADFTIRNAMDRINKRGDIFKPVLGKGIDIKKFIKQNSK
jgi:bifunctional non-homologous end joining protein LigD